MTHPVKVSWLCDRWESNVIGSGGVPGGVWLCCTVRQLALMEYWGIERGRATVPRVAVHRRHVRYLPHGSCYEKEKTYLVYDECG